MSIFNALRFRVFFDFQTLYGFRELTLSFLGTRTLRDSLCSGSPQSEGQSLHASRSSRLCAQAQLVDDMPFCTRAYTKVIRGSQTVSDTVLKHDLCELVIAEGKGNGVNILKSIDEGPFQMGTVREPLAAGTEGAPHLGPERPRIYSDLSPEEKDRYNADIRATNILLQGLPNDIYTLINHYTDAKDIWDNVKMLLEGSELTKEDQESQLYDDFEHF
nr:integrase, catalytic region, zinc finger, CCHC-type, peptidase aspartic, catalytic [Tanacetum cinerariifolium]